MTLAEDPTSGATIVTNALSGLGTDVSTVITFGIGVGAIVLVATIAWRVVKKFVRG